MAYRVTRASLEAAVRHLVRYGDTDIFPHLPELAFFADEEAAIVDELSKLDLDSYTPAGAIEALAPKGRYSFRIAHQLSALDTMLLLGCVIDIGDKIEAKRQSVKNIRSFSYRFLLDRTKGEVFRSGRTFKDWLYSQQRVLESAGYVTHVVSTDISDYYSRINFHRLENLLDDVAPKHGAIRFIKKHIGIIRARQSFGLPVGGSAARLLAELALVDADEVLRSVGLIVTRFVDDFKIFLKASDHPYDALGYLAEQLGINEGLSLNSAKTFVTEREKHREYLDSATSSLYFEGGLDEADLEKLKGLNLVEMLEKEIDSDIWDMGRIKVLFRALKIAKPEEAVDFIKRRFDNLVVFGKELVLLMEALESDELCCFDELTGGGDSGYPITASVKYSDSTNVAVGNFCAQYHRDFAFRNKKVGGATSGH
jgi:hypothetical protein